MGAWGYGNFENDDAMDWVADLEGYSDDGMIIDTLNTIIDQADDYPEAPDCSGAVVAAETIAALLGEPHEDCPDEIDAWVEERTSPSATLVAKARQAVEVIMSNSELKDLWQESEDFEAWQSSLEDLLTRLPY